MNTEAKKLIVMLNASAIKISGCSLNLFNTIIEGYTTKLQANDVEFGSAFHRFKAAFKKWGREGFAKGLQEAQEYFNATPMYVKSNKKYLDCKFLLQACLGYAETYEKDSFELLKLENGEPLIELPFCFPIHVDELCEILIVGTMDEIGKFNNGIYSIEDVKTTSVWNVDEYLNSYRLSPQLYFYRWAIRQYAKAQPDGFFAKMEQDVIGCHINGVFFKGKDKPIEYKRSDVMIFKEAELLEFELMLVDKIKQLIEIIHSWLTTGNKPPREGMLNGSCTTIFGPCKFSNACAATDKETRDIILEQSFIKRFYNPLALGANQ